MRGGARPGPARLAALEVVSRTLAGEYLAPTLRSVLDASSLEGVNRSLVTDLSYGALRRLQQIDAHLQPALKQPAKLPPRVLAALRLGVLELLYRHTPPHAAVSEWVEVVKAEAPGLASLANAVLRGVERRAAAESAGTEAPHGRPSGQLGDRSVDPVIDLSLPPWLWDELVSALGADAALAAGLGMLDPEPLWLTSFSPRAEPALQADGCDVARAQPGAAYPASLRVRSPRPLDALSAYRDGSVQPQNPASLQAALALAVEPGQVVFDLAAGSGIKSAVLAAAGARVTAVELSRRRSRAAAANLERLRLSVVHVTADLVATAPETLLERIATANGWPAPRLADAVLLDAPCSGTGTLRGHPEIKQRLRSSDLPRLAAAQATMLRNAAGLVAPGGRLLYAVCALTNAEGPDVLDGFLSDHPDFSAAEVSTGLPVITARGAGTFVLPVDGLDGFYLARVRRSPAVA